MPPIKSALENGVRVLVEPVTHVQSAAIGLWCRTGSRHENEDEAGITHLIEHMLFKGTARRTSKQIAEAIEGRGGMLNAFTDKESTCYYCRVLAEEVPTAIDVLSDMMLNSLLEPQELQREIGVVLEEIKRGEDEPDNHVHDLHVQNRWGQHPLGKPIIGTRNSVSGFKRENLVSYMQRRYLGSNVILSVAGNVDPDCVNSIARDLLGSIPAGGVDPQLDRPIGTARTEYVAKDVEQVHFCIGSDGVSVYDEELFTAAVLDSALGGSMSSRLFQEIREKRGLAYSVGSYCLNYTAGGTYTVFGGTGREMWDEVQELVFKEFGKVREHGLEEEELDRTKRNICGSLVLGLEGMSSRMMRNSRNEMLYGRFIPIGETMARINGVTNASVIELAGRILDPSGISITVIGPA